MDGMASIEAFNDLLLRFVDELAMTFPEHADLPGYRTLLADLISVNHKQPMDMFMGALGSHTSKIFARDPTFFQDCPRLFDRIDILAMWQADISDGTREAIWQYLTALLSMATTLSLAPMIPADMMHSIQAMAQQCAEDVQSGKLDISQLAGALFGGGAGGGAGGFDLSRLLGP